MKTKFENFMLYIYFRFITCNLFLKVSNDVIDRWVYANLLLMYSNYSDAILTSFLLSFHVDG